MHFSFHATKIEEAQQLPLPCSHLRQRNRVHKFNWTNFTTERERTHSQHTMMSPSSSPCANSNNALLLPSNLSPRQAPHSPISVQPTLSLQAPPSLHTDNVYQPARFLTIDDLPPADADFLALPSFDESCSDDDASMMPIMPRLAPRFQQPNF